jgi:uncharacterized protein
MTGFGGGSLMTPLLIRLFAIHPATAVGTDLVYAAVTKSGGTVVGLNRTIEWRVVGLLAAGSVPITAATLFAPALPGIHVQALMTRMLSSALFATAIVLILHRDPGTLRCPYRRVGPAADGRPDSIRWRRARFASGQNPTDGTVSK